MESPSPVHRCSVDENWGKIYVSIERIAAKKKAEKIKKQKAMRVALNVSASNNLFVRIFLSLWLRECLRIMNFWRVFLSCSSLNAQFDSNNTVPTSFGISKVCYFLTCVICQVRFRINYWRAWMDKQRQKRIVHTVSRCDIHLIFPNAKYLEFHRILNHVYMWMDRYLIKAARQ